MVHLVLCTVCCASRCPVVGDASFHLLLASQRCAACLCSYPRVRCGRYLVLPLLQEASEWGVSLDTHTYNAALAVCERAGQWETVVQLNQDMKERGVPRDDVTFATVLSALAMGGQVTAAEELLQLMRERGVHRNTLAFNAMLAAYRPGGDVSSAVALLEEMKDLGEE